MIKQIDQQIQQLLKNKNIDKILINQIYFLLKFIFYKDIITSQQYFSSLIQNTHYQIIQNESILFKQSQNINNYYFLIKGNIKYQNYAANGQKKQTFLNQSEIIGQYFYNKNQKRINTCILYPDSHILYINKNTFNFYYSQQIKQFFKIINLLQQIGFSSHNFEIIGEIYKDFKIKKLKIGDIFIQDDNNIVYYILQGSCQIIIDGNIFQLDRGCAFNFQQLIGQVYRPSKIRVLSSYLIIFSLSYDLINKYLQSSFTLFHTLYQYHKSRSSQSSNENSFRQTCKLPLLVHNSIFKKKHVYKLNSKCIQTKKHKSQQKPPKKQFKQFKIGFFKNYLNLNFIRNYQALDQNNIKKSNQPRGYFDISLNNRKLKSISNKPSQHKQWTQYIVARHSQIKSVSLFKSKIQQKQNNQQKKKAVKQKFERTFKKKPTRLIKVSGKNMIRAVVYSNFSPFQRN